MATEGLSEGWKVQGQITVFVNHVDCFITEYIAKYISSSVVGVTQMETDLQEEFIQREKSTSSFNVQPPNQELLYRVIGSLKDPQVQKPNFVKAIVSNKNLQEMYMVLQQCDIVIYDIASDPSQRSEALFMAQKFTENLLKMDKGVKKVFIAISSILTWCSIQPADPDDPSAPISDEDYRRRRPHADYRELYTAEKLLLQYRRKKKNMLTYVIAPGLVYGDKEETFHHLFKAAWLNKAVIPLTGKGNNHLPTIHIKDLTRIIQHVIEIVPPTFHYVLAVDQSQNTLKEIAKAINRAMGSGTLQEVDLSDTLETFYLDLLTVDLKMTCPLLAEAFRFAWQTPNGMVEHMTELVNEFKDQRNLKPLKVIMLGPPGTGKSSITRRLQDSHKLHVINIDDVRTNLMSQLEQRRQEKEAIKLLEERSVQSFAISPADADDDAETEMEGDEKEKEEKEENEAFLDGIEEVMAENGRVLEDSLLVSFLRRILLSKPFQNQGFVLDGFPSTAEQVTLLFGTLDKINEAKLAGKSDPDALKIVSILPDQVIMLSAEDEFLKERIRNLPASMVEGTENEEKSFSARLEAYRRLNTVESSIEDYLDELEFNISFYDISKDTTGVNANIISQVKFSIGPPRTYGPGKEELEMVKQAEMELLQKAEREQREEEERLNAEEESIFNEKKLQWMKKHKIVEQEDQQLSEAQALPLRHYLFRYVMPTLLDALTDCCKIMPDDPLDYLAEYLLKCNPVVD